MKQTSKFNKVKFKVKFTENNFYLVILLIGTSIEINFVINNIIIPSTLYLIQFNSRVSIQLIHLK